VLAGKPCADDDTVRRLAAQHRHMVLRSVNNLSDPRSAINFGALWGGEGEIELATRKDTFPGSRRLASLRLFTPGGAKPPVYFPNGP
jgi:hypothetical protein